MKAINPWIAPIHQTEYKGDPSEFKAWLLPQCEAVWEKWQFINLWPLAIKNIETDSYAPNEPGKEKLHTSSHMVVLLVDSKSLEAGEIYFKNPLHYHWASYPQEKSINGDWAPVKAKAGDVFFFPGFLEYIISKNLSQENKVITTVHLSLDFFKPRNK